MADERRISLKVLLRIEEGAFANLVLRSVLQSSKSNPKQAGLITELVYGTTRMRRSCDYVIDLFVTKLPIEDLARVALRLGVYQLVFTDIPSHAAVSETVEVVPKRLKGLVNAVLRKVSLALPIPWPKDAVALSYPDWIIDKSIEDLGQQPALDALAYMNQPAKATIRFDGYTQGKSSQLVSELLPCLEGDILDLCAAPGGKTTYLATKFPQKNLVAADIHLHRANLIKSNISKLELSNISTVVCDSTCAPFRPESFSNILIDAPCSGFGVLGKRADARWRIQEKDIDDLVKLQKNLLIEAMRLTKPNGSIVYSVCTFSKQETIGIDKWLAESYPNLVACDYPGLPWRKLGRGGIILPQDYGGDGMYILSLTNNTLG